MIFRKRNKPSIVKYTFDESYASESMDASSTPIGMKDQEVSFKAWTDYPAMRSCDMIRKIPTHTNFAYENTVGDQVVTGVEASRNTNMAAHNIKMWQKIKKMLPPMPNQQQISMALVSLLDQSFTARQKTIRACPPIKDLLTQTLLVKCPTDIHFAKGKARDMYENVVPLAEEHMEETRWHWFTPAKHLKSKADPWSEHHPKNQYCYGETSQIKGYTNLKINTGIKLDVPDHVSVMMTQPVFHNIRLPMTVIPGIFIYPMNKCVSVITNFFIPDDTPDFILKKGDALCYLTFSEHVKFEEDERGADNLVNFTFDTPRLSWRNLAKKFR